MKNTKGITLIALVITIIVLLILAGISISMLSGDNSILSKATLSKQLTAEKSLKEESQVVISGRIIERKRTGTNKKTLKEELEEQLSDVDEVTPINGTIATCYVKKGNIEYTVYDNGEVEEGKIEIWDGNTITCPEFKKENEVWNWYIYTPAQFKFFANFVNNGNTLTEEQESLVINEGYSTDDVKIEEDKTKVYLMNNIDLGARQTDGIVTSGSNWIPIGSTENPFTGIFEGNNYIVKGMYINLTDRTTNLGLFGRAKNIQNLTIKDSYIKGLGSMGGLLGSLITEGKIENCHNVNTNIIAERDVFGCTAGIVGNTLSSTQIKNCSNSGKIIGYRQIAGITGWTNGIVSNCINTGTIVVKRYIGAGIVAAGTEGTYIEDCINRGVIIGEKTDLSAIGGIAGQLYDHCTIINCSNYERIEGKGQYIGGIAGFVTYDNDTNKNAYCTLNKCYNIGEVKGGNSGTCVGGIIGRLSASYDQTVTNCYNKGNINGSNNKGEIIGYVSGSAYTLNNLFYLARESSLGKAIGNKNDDLEKKIKETEDDLTYEQFKIWIEEKD